MNQIPIVLMKDGASSSQGKPQIIGNINACQVVSDAIRTTLGPRGMDKLIVDERGNTTISNDGATIMKALEVVHPAAKMLVEIAKSQDSEIGDGTTSVVLLAAEIMINCKKLIEDGLHSSVLISGLRRGMTIALNSVSSLAIKLENLSDSKTNRPVLEKCAGTSLNSKLIAQEKQFFAKMVVDAVTVLDDDVPINMVGIKRVPGGCLTDTTLVKGVAFKKTFSYAGFEMQPKLDADNPLIALLNIELELKAERDNAEIRLDNVNEYQKVVDTEWKILYDKLRILHESNVKIVLSKLPIGDVATQFFADHDMFCAGRVPEEDMKRTKKCCGGSVVSTVKNLNKTVLGTCERFEEIQIGSERFNMFTGCPKAKSSTIIIRGGADQFTAECERSLHDAIMIVRRTMKNDAIVPGGGAVEMEISKALRNEAKTTKGKEQVVLMALGKAFEVIPRQLCENAGFDSTDILSHLRLAHFENKKNYGVDINHEDIADNYEKMVWEPAVVKNNSIQSAIEASCLLLGVDETLQMPRSENNLGNQPARIPNEPPRA
ncbi:hypothetical protein SNEBB_006540 [Seison nebaliae]|nr:hypothetical protein SNEBB_006540 [Seison nebaliae]